MTSPGRLGGTAAVVLNYRTPHETVDAVRSLEGSDSPASIIIVIDNGSGDGSAEILRSSLPDVRLIATDSNQGFSAGCNHGIREAMRLGADRVFLLNSDAIVPSDALGILERALGSDAELGIVGPVLVSRSNPNEVESLGMTYAASTARVRHMGFRSRRDSLAPFGVRQADGVSGCAMLIKTEVFDRAGLLAEEYFFGFEDLDFCLRARQAGYLSACVGMAFVLHEGSLSIGQRSELRTYFGTRNHLLLGTRHVPSDSFLRRRYQTLAVLAFNFAHVLVRSDVPRRHAFRGFVRGVRDHLTGRYGAAPVTRDLT